MSTITVNSKEFSKCFDKVRKASVVNAKWSRNIQMFNIDGGTLKMMCGNESLFTSYEMDCVATGVYFDDEMMKVAVDAVALSNCLSKKGETSFSIDGDNLVVESNGEKSMLPLEDFVEFEIDHLGGSDSTVYVNLSEMLKTVSSFSSLFDIEFRKQLCHITFTHDGERVKLFATDTFRLIEMHQKSSYTTRPVAIHKDHANVIADIYKKCDAVNSRINDAYVQFASDGIVTYVKTANTSEEGLFMPSGYAPIFEGFERHKSSSFDAMTVAEFIKNRAKIDASSSYDTTTIEVSGNEMTVTLSMNNNKSYPTRVLKTPVKADSDYWTKLDPRYLLRALNAIGSNDFRLLTQEPDEKIKFLWGNDVSILMPMVNKER